MRKWFLRIVVALGVLVVVALVAIYFSIDGLVRYGVERGATEATGQSTSLHAASVSIVGGTLELSGLEVANPSGYSSGNMLVMKQCKASAKIGSLLTNDVVIPSIAIEGLEVTVEQKGLGSNLTDVLKVGQSTTAATGGGGGGGGASAPTPAGRNIHVGVITLTGTIVHLNVLGQTTTLDLGPIDIDDPTNPDGRPMKMADVVAKVLANVAQQIANDPRIPAAVRTGIAAVNGIGGNLTNLLKDHGKDLGENINDIFKKK